MRRLLLSGLALFLVVALGSKAQAADFVRSYGKGKLFLKQKLYFDAIKEFNVVVTKTAKGANHFGAHFYLAKSYYWLPDIQKAMKILDKAKGLIKNKAQKGAHAKLIGQIKELYGIVKFVPEVDPEEVGKLKFELQPRSAFSHKHKQRYFRILAKRLKQQGGIILNDRPLFVPKGDYLVGLERPQCLRYGISDGKQFLTQITVGDEPTSITVQEKRSCKCKGGQKIYKERDRLYCACKPGSGWNKKKERCELVKKGTPIIPLALGIGGGVLVAGGAAAAIIYFATREPLDVYHLAAPGSSAGENKVKIWKNTPAPSPSP